VASNKEVRAHMADKTCLVCGLPMQWRKKWAKNWDDVKYCSERCRRQRRNAITEVKQ
jgi:hypothetical protein